MRMITTEDFKRLRREAGLTQKQLSEKAGVSQSLIARIERGTVDPRLSTVRRITQALAPTKNNTVAKDIMSSPVENVNSRDTIKTIVDIMKKTGFSQLPVLMDGRIVGNIHESAILERIARSSNPEHVMSSLVYNLMDKPFLTISQSESVEKIVSLLASGEPALLVVENGKLLGIITKIDVLCARIQSFDGER